MVLRAFLPLVRADHVDFSLRLQQHLLFLRSLFKCSHLFSALGQISVPLGGRARGRGRQLTLHGL